MENTPIPQPSTTDQTEVTPDLDPTPLIYKRKCYGRMVITGIKTYYVHCYDKECHDCNSWFKLGRRLEHSVANHGIGGQLENTPENNKLIADFKKANKSNPNFGDRYALRRMPQNNGSKFWMITPHVRKNGPLMDVYSIQKELIDNESLQPLLNAGFQLYYHKPILTPQDPYDMLAGEYLSEDGSETIKLADLLWHNNGGPVTSVGSRKRKNKYEFKDYRFLGKKGKYVLDEEDHIVVHVDAVSFGDKDIAKKILEQHGNEIGEQIKKITGNSEIMIEDSLKAVESMINLIADQSAQAIVNILSGFGDDLDQLVEDHGIEFETRHTVVTSVSDFSDTMRHFKNQTGLDIRTGISRSEKIAAIQEKHNLHPTVAGIMYYALGGEKMLYIPDKIPVAARMVARALKPPDDGNGGNTKMALTTV